jgi:4'-phosphopantetheinyl transferase EntD
MIAQLLPAAVASAAIEGDEPVGELLPEEEAQLSAAVESRRLEFIAGRTCARRALRQLGLPETPILRGGRRQPLWPDGIVGSITHCTGYRAAAAARTLDVLSIGIDAEPHAALPEGVLHSVSLPEERSWLASAPAHVHWDRVLFSAKESVFKAWFPLTGRFLGFEQALLHFEPLESSFHASILHERREFSGRYLIANGLVLTAVVVPQPGGGPQRSTMGR